MTDAEIVDRIDRLAHAQQEIYLRHSRSDRRDEDPAQLRFIKDELARCWGIRRAARAVRDADRFTDDPAAGSDAGSPLARVRRR